MLGILLIDKPIGCTSHDVVNVLRRRLSTKRVGHAGTLDPLASGLLVVAVGPATRFLQYLPLEPKEYVAEITFGEATTTFDREGEVTASGDVPTDLEGAIADVKPTLTGLIQQLPPMFSAVKIQGKPLYKYARSGQEVAREPRTVHIAAFDILETKGATAIARIECSGGTYIRTLAHDLGAAMGCGAHLSALQRTRVGKFSLGAATPLEDVGESNLLSLDDALVPMPIMTLTPEQTAFVRDGRQLALAEEVTAPLVALFDPSYGVFSVARVSGNLLQPECVIPSEAIHGAL